tara:strand:- start:3828 stop:5495 length:1668 start_codon:yes stop_codon:yes gene_type:complete
MIIHFFQIISIFLLVSLFILSCLGYGKFLRNIVFKDHSLLNVGEAGLLGIFFLIILSYISSFLFPHNSTHNIVVLILGFFLFFFKKEKIELKHLKLLLLVILISFSFFLISKNHDDFPYYHLPFALSLSENKISFGMGLLNYGYRHHSSILFLNSLTYLPIIKYFLFNLPNYLILIFVNFLLINNLIENYKKKNIVFLLSLIFFSVINIKFTRLSEYGTDISGQIILFVIIINFIDILVNEKRIDKIYYNLFLLLIVLSFKVYFLIYFILVLSILYYLKINPLQKKYFNYKAVTFYLLFLALFVAHNFVSTGCVIYPMDVTCVGTKYFWTLDVSEVKRMSLWLESWAKAGASPNFRVDNLSEYVKGINWVQGWFNRYFIGKVSDYLLIIFVVNLIVFFSFNKKVNLEKDFIKIQKILIITSVIALLIWFFKHPSLRYGGYLPITVLITSLFLFFYSSIKFKNNNYKITKIFVISVFIIFNLKNIIRLDSEFSRKDQYQFNNFPYFAVEDKKYKNLKIDNINYMYTTNGYCWATPTPCSNTPRKARIINNFIFFER